MPKRVGPRLSPYCVLHADPDGQHVTLLNSLYGSRFSIAADLLPALAELNAGVPLDAVLATLPQAAREAIQLLVDERVLITADESPELAERSPFRHRLTPIELAVQRGFNEGGYLPDRADSRDAPTISRETRSTRTVPLEAHTRPDQGIDLAACLERRRSLRRYDQRPLAQRELELFLQLSARARASNESSIPDGGLFRPYPSAGALYPLEIYPVIYSVDGVEPGIYHYQPFKHQLAALGSDPAHRHALQQWARQKMAVSSPTGPAVLFLITAVFERTCRKYSGMAYQAILTETGALCQTMYLVATFLGLAPCAVGAFPERATAELLGVDSRDESQVGMFALGAPERQRDDSSAP